MINKFNKNKARSALRSQSNIWVGGTQAVCVTPACVVCFYASLTRRSNNSQLVSNRQQLSNQPLVIDGCKKPTLDSNYETILWLFYGWLRIDSNPWRVKDQAGYLSISNSQDLLSLGTGWWFWRIFFPLMTLGWLVNWNFWGWGTTTNQYSCSILLMHPVAASCNQNHWYPTIQRFPA